MKMTKKTFLFLLSLRKQLRGEAENLIGIGFDINSDRVGNLFRLSESIEDHIADALKLEPFAYNLNTLTWALEYLDKEEAAKYSADGEDREIKTFDDLWKEIQEDSVKSCGRSAPFSSELRVGERQSRCCAPDGA